MRPHRLSQTRLNSKQYLALAAPCADYAAVLHAGDCRRHDRPPPRSECRSSDPLLFEGMEVGRSGRWGALRSEVKEEAGRSPLPGDMSGAECPAGLITRRRRHEPSRVPLN